MNQLLFENFLVSATILEEEAKALEDSIQLTLTRIADLRTRAATLRAEVHQYDPDAKEEVRRRSCIGKKSYKTVKAAGEAANTIRAKRGVQLRIYHCEFCDQFHFTSQSLEQFTARKVA